MDSRAKQQASCQKSLESVSDFLYHHWGGYWKLWATKKTLVAAHLTHWNLVTWPLCHDKIWWTCTISELWRKGQAQGRPLFPCTTFHFWQHMGYYRTYKNGNASCYCSYRLPNERVLGKVNYHLNTANWMTNKDLGKGTNACVEIQNLTKRRQGLCQCEPGLQAPYLGLPTRVNLLPRVWAKDPAMHIEMKPILPRGCWGRAPPLTFPLGSTRRASLVTI